MPKTTSDYIREAREYLESHWWLNMSKEELAADMIMRDGTQDDHWEYILNVEYYRGWQKDDRTVGVLRAY